MFRILYYGRKSDYYTIQQISILSNYIQQFGISSIRQIIFEFGEKAYYPYLQHNISLCNTRQSSFFVQFYHYYNSFNQCIILHPDMQKQDYQTLVQFLQCYPVLQQMLLPYIYPPFINDLNKITY